MTVDEESQRRSPGVTEPGYRAGVAPPNKGQTYVPTLLRSEHVSALLEWCGEKATGTRNRALIGFLYRTGVSISEAVEVKVSDLDMTPGTENVRIATGRLAARTLALDCAVLSLLRPWLEVRTAFPRDHLFCVTQRENQGNAIRSTYVREFLNGLAVASGLGTKRVHPHAFRFSLVAELMVEQWPLPYIQTQLGIKNLSSLQTILDHLGICPPDDEEVMEIIRNRPTWSPVEAAP